MFLWLLAFMRNQVATNDVFKKATPVIALFFIWLGWILLQVIPLPPGWVANLSPAAFEFHNLGNATGLMTLSLDPYATCAGWFKSLTYILIFILSLLLIHSRRRLRQLAYVIIYSGLFQAVYGSLMTLSGLGYGFFIQNPSALDVATGTFINRNHLAGYLVMALSVGIGMMIVSLDTESDYTAKQRLRCYMKLILSKKLRLRLYLAMMVIALVLTHSRMGNTSFFASLLIAGGLGLLLSKHATPDPGVSSLRSDGLIKYLAEFGWQPVVLTSKMTDERRKLLYKDIPVYESPSFDVMRFLRQPMSLGVTEDTVRFGMPAFNSNETPKSVSEKLKHFVKCCTAFPDRHNGWWFATSKLAKKIVRDRNVKLVISTSPPWTTALVGASLTRSVGVPWIADCQDLWSQYHRYDFGSIRLILDRWLERRTLSSAAALVVVSALRAKKLQKLHPNSRVESITLGVDPLHFDSAGVSPSKDIFTLTHVGKLKGQQNAKPLFSLFGYF
jgi:hypothetical protein